MPAVFSCPNGHVRTLGADENLHPDARASRCSSCNEGGYWVFLPSRYEITRVLGSGGMGVVFHATDHELQRTVAIKTFYPFYMQKQRLLQRFNTEAAAIADLQHPNIVSLLDARNEEGQPYIVMEYVDGGSLEDFLASGTKPAREIAALVETLARAMHYAHGRGVVHRDLKPSNILITQSGIPKIADFGLAKLMHHSENLTQSGEILGTMKYMSPEQAMGHTKEVGPHSDIFSLGIILYQLLTARTPVIADATAILLFKIIYEVPECPKKLRRDLPQEIDTICMKAIQKEARNRYHDAGAFADDLRRFISGESIQADRRSLTISGVRWATLKANSTIRDDSPGMEGAEAQEHLSDASAPTRLLQIRGDRLFGGRETNSELRARAREDSDPTRILDGSAGGAEPPPQLQLSSTDQSMALFDGLAPDQAKAIVQSGGFREYTTGEQIFREGEQADGLYILLDGTVEITKNDDQKEVFVKSLGPNDIFGEMGLILPKARRTASVRASTHVRVFRLPGNPFELIRAFAEPKTFMTFLHNLIAILQKKLEQSRKLSLLVPAYQGPDLHIQASMMDLRAVLQSLRAPLAEETYRHLFSEKFAPPGELLFEAGNLEDGFYFIYSGLLETVGTSDEAESGAISQLSAPCFVGDIGLLSRRKRTLGLRAVSDLKYVSCRRSEFELLRVQNAQEANKVLFALVQLLVLLIVELDALHLPVESPSN